MLSTHLRLGLPSGLLLTGFPTNILYAFLLYPIRATCPATSVVKIKGSVMTASLGDVITAMIDVQHF
jgi:hypothetical protein